MAAASAAAADAGPSDAAAAAAPPYFLHPVYDPVAVQEAHVSAYKGFAYLSFAEVGVFAAEAEAAEARAAYDAFGTGGGGETEQGLAGLLLGEDPYPPGSEAPAAEEETNEEHAPSEAPGSRKTGQGGRGGDGGAEAMKK